MSRQYLGSMQKLLAALRFYSPVPLVLLCSCNALSGWDTKHPVDPKNPITLQLAIAVAVLSIQEGEAAHGYLYLLMYFAKLRHSEAVQVTSSSLFPPGYLDQQGVTTSFASILLPRTKTGPNKVALVKDPLGIKVLCRLKTLLSNHSTWPSVWTFNSALARRVRLLGLDLNLTSHCFRRGSAVADYMNGVPIRTIMEDGRWASQRSLRRYLEISRFLIVRYPQCTHPVFLAARATPLRMLQLG